MQNRYTANIYYGFDKQRILSVERGVDEESKTIRKYVDKYYEEEWVYCMHNNSEIRISVRPEVNSSNDSLTINGYSFSGYKVPNYSDTYPHQPSTLPFSSLVNMPGYIHVNYFCSLDTLHEIYYIPFPIPDELSGYLIYNDFPVKFVRKLHYIYSGVDDLVGIYVEHFTPWGTS
jgi:hypothetical protein